MSAPSIDRENAIQRLMQLLAISGISGEEAAIAADIRERVVALELAGASVVEDDAHRRSPFGGSAGNLIIRLPGAGALAAAPTLLISAHMDTVPLCAGAVPRRVEERIVPASGETALGADNRSGCAALLTLLHELGDRDHRPLTLVFFVQEEVGLVGSRLLDPALLGNPAGGINVDGGAPEEICHGAIGGIKWELSITGQAAHAGVHPEDGVSAAAVFALAHARLINEGWHGAIRQGDQRGTANIGTVHGGSATNVVMDQLMASGECRSHDAAFLERIFSQYQSCFREAAAMVTNAAGESASVCLIERNRYPAFHVGTETPLVRNLAAAIAAMGGTPCYKISNGAQDANNLSRRHGIPTVTIGAGAHHLHTVREYLDIAEYLRACQLLVAIATS